MSVEREQEDAATDLTALDPRKRRIRFWPETTPTLGATPTLPDDDVKNLAEEARNAASEAFGIVRPAPEAGPRDRE